MYMFFLISFLCYSIINSNQITNYDNINYLSLPNNETYAFREVRNYNVRTVLLLHSIMSSSLIFKSGGFFETMDSFLQDYRIIAPDLRGNGLTTYNKNINDLWDLVDDLKLFLDKKNINEVVIIGNCVGGLVAKLFSIKYPEYVKALVLVGSIGIQGGGDIFKEEDHFPSNITDIKKSNYYIRLKGAFLSNNNTFISNWYSKKDIKDKEILIEDALLTRNLKEILWSITITNISTEKNFYGIPPNNLVDKIKSPLLIIHSVDDYLSPFSQAFLLFNSKHSKNCKLVILKEVGHFPWLDDLNKTISPIKDYFENIIPEYFYHRNYYLSQKGDNIQSFWFKIICSVTIFIGVFTCLYKYGQ